MVPADRRRGRFQRFSWYREPYGRSRYRRTAPMKFAETFGYFCKRGICRFWRANRPLPFHEHE